MMSSAQSVSDLESVCTETELTREYAAVPLRRHRGLGRDT